MQVCQRVYGLDISEETIKFNQEAKEVYSLNNLFLINASVTSIPLKKNSVKESKLNQKRGLDTKRRFT